MKIKTANTILYCSKWEETVRFYRDHLNLTVIFLTDWFVEFYLSTATRLSIADEKRASIKSCNGKGITVDTSTEGFLHEDNPVLLDYYDFRDQFGRDEKIAIAVKSNDIFSFSFLEKLKDLHNDLEENVPHVAEVTSLINARNMRGEESLLIVEDLLEEWPKTQKDLTGH